MKTTHVPLLDRAIRAAAFDVDTRVPSMMSRDERALLLALARSYYRGNGMIMDAGVFCGASTVCFGQGILASPMHDEIVARWGKPVQTYEYGIVNPGMITFFERHGVAGAWQVGASFEPYLRGNIAPVAGLVDLHMGDISGAAWNGAPIEIMFLDVLKDAAIQQAVMRTFLPSLLPGGILIQQDYFIDGVPFVKIFQEYLRGYFDYLGEIQSSAVFRLIKAIPASLVASDPTGGLTLAEQLALLDVARARSIDRERQFICDTGKVRFLADLGHHDAAQHLLADLHGVYPELFAAPPSPRIATAIRAATNRAQGRVYRKPAAA
jgi:predicted O-methyltransferase YrrM